MSNFFGSWIRLICQNRLGKNEAVIGETIEWIKNKYPQFTGGGGNNKNGNQKVVKKVQKFEELFTQEQSVSVTETSLLE